MSKFQEKIQKVKQEYKSYRAKQIYKTFEELQDIISKRGKEVSPETAKVFNTNSNFGGAGIGYDWFHKINNFKKQAKEEMATKQYEAYIEETILDNYTTFKQKVYSAEASKDRMLNSIKNKELKTTISTEELSDLANSILEEYLKIWKDPDCSIAKHFIFQKEFYLKQIKQAEEAKNNDFLTGCKRSLLKVIYNYQEFLDYHNVSKNNDPLIPRNQPSLLLSEEMEWITENNISLHQEESVELLGTEN